MPRVSAAKSRIFATLTEHPDWSYARVAESMGVCTATVYQHAKKAGIKRRVYEPGSTPVQPIIYAQVSGVTGDNLSYSVLRTGHLYALPDGLYEVVPPDSEDVTAWTYMCLAGGIPHMLLNPYLHIPVKEEQTLTQFTYLVYRHLEAQSAKYAT